MPTFTDRRVTNWLSLRRTEKGTCDLRLTLATEAGSISLKRNLTLQQLEQLIAAAKRLASEVRGETSHADAE